MYAAKQKGITFIAVVIVLALIGIFTLSILKVFPVYMEHLSVQTAMEAIEVDPEIKTMSVSQMRRLLEKKLDINQVTSVAAKDAKINRTIGEITFKVEYEVRKDYIGNVDIILSFSDEFEVPL
ncbi:MAG: DUF4845 domain-containing protein [Cycloclasticus sp.]|nr:MAG: DUF4845 domain-containing protein [Cycloclasticus sp.]